MFAWTDTSWENAKTARGYDVTLADLNQGMIAGTRVATAIGWRRVEAICEGDQVLTFDGGLQTVIAVSRHVVFTENPPADIADWPLLVPAGALGNREEIRMLPRQAILIESDVAEEMFGDPFALVPAVSLEGFRGITPCRPMPRMEVIILHFARDEVVFANTGALFYCPAHTDIMSDLFEARSDDSYSVLTIDQADLLVSCLEIEDGLPSQAGRVVFAAA